MLRKLTLFAAFTMVVCGYSFGQFTIMPVPASVEGDPGQLLKAIATITNTSNETLDFTWERITNDLESGWSTAICDPIACRAPFVDSESFSLDPGGSGTFSAWFTTTSEGTGFVELKIWVQGDSLNTVQFNNYTATAGDATSLEEVYADVLTVYPNPATSYITLPDHADVSRAVMYNVLGKMMKTFELGAGFEHQVFVGDLPRGNYLVQFLNSEGDLLHTTKIAKQ
ncbi:MAG: T9SS type A sorting domain-containing protein [Bacteroidota bacterium]